jgi:hypothetical protein
LPEAVVNPLKTRILLGMLLGSMAACSSPATDPTTNAANVMGGEATNRSVHATAAGACGAALTETDPDYPAVESCYEVANAAALTLIESTLAAAGSSTQGQAARTIGTYQNALDALAFQLGADKPPASRTTAWVDDFFGEGDARSISQLMDGYADLGGYRVEPFEEDRDAILIPAFPDCFRGLGDTDPVPVECVEAIVLGRAADVAQIATAADSTLDAATAQAAADDLIRSALDGAHGACATLAAAVGNLPLSRGDDERNCRMTAAMQILETIAYFIPVQ